MTGDVPAIGTTGAYPFDFDRPFPWRHLAAITADAARTWVRTHPEAAVRSHERAVIDGNKNYVVVDRLPDFVTAIYRHDFSFYLIGADVSTK